MGDEAPELQNRRGLTPANVVAPALLPSTPWLVLGLYALNIIDAWLIRQC